MTATGPAATHRIPTDGPQPVLTGLDLPAVQAWVGAPGAGGGGA